MAGQPAVAGPEEPAGLARAAGLDDNLTCAICLDQIAPEDLAAIPGCGHQYCGAPPGALRGARTAAARGCAPDAAPAHAVNCVLYWASRKESPWCPQCRTPFSQLRLHRKLDGAPRDLPGLESLCLLKRTAWFQEYAQVPSLARSCPCWRPPQPYLPLKLGGGLQAREQGRNPAVPRLLSEHDAAAAGPSGYEELLEYQDYDRYFQDYDEDEEVSPCCHPGEVALQALPLLCHSATARWPLGG